MNRINKVGGKKLRDGAIMRTGAAIAGNDPEYECCADWTIQLAHLLHPILFVAGQTGAKAYEGAQFKYCPWCGKNRLEPNVERLCSE